MRRVGFWLLVAVFFVPAVVFTVGAFIAHARWARSNDTQHHGVDVRGHVSAIAQQVADERTIHPVSSQLTITVLPPVDHIVVTTVHVEGPITIETGDTISAVVDPTDHDYAELPGRPAVDPTLWSAAAGFAFALYIATGLMVRTGIRSSRDWLPIVTEGRKEYLRNKRKRAPKPT